jgi:hypothetical protein
METPTTMSIATDETPNAEGRSLPSAWRLTWQAECLDAAPWPERRAFREYAMGICATRHRRRVARIRAWGASDEDAQGRRFLARALIVCEHVRYLVARPLFWWNITTSLQSI